jgi:hypothetical protein
MKKNEKKTFGFHHSYKKFYTTGPNRTLTNGEKKYFQFFIFYLLLGLSQASLSISG